MTKPASNGRVGAVALLVLTGVWFVVVLPAIIYFY